MTHKAPAFVEFQNGLLGPPKHPGGKIAIQLAWCKDSSQCPKVLGRWGSSMNRETRQGVWRIIDLFVHPRNCPH